jgi:phosphoglycolate phosphatase-like HAD superfamily hydrolase
MVPATVWVFDVDGCLVDSLTGTSLRPGAPELLAHLRQHDCRVLLWSAGGADHARRRAQEQGIVELIDGFHSKEGRDNAGHYVIGFLADPRAAVFVDDRPEDIPLGTDVVAVSPYLVDNPHDRGLALVAARAGYRCP